MKTKFWQIWVDTGGTFTDCLAIDPEGKWHRTKVLSSSSLRGRIESIISDKEISINTNWGASNNIFEGYQLRLLDRRKPGYLIESFDPDRRSLRLSAQPDPEIIGRDFEITAEEEAPILASRIITNTPLTENLPPIQMRLGSTRGTNALLERKGAEVILLITKGFKDLLEIGTQQRPDIFSLEIKKRKPLYSHVIEVEERLDAQGKVILPLEKEHIREVLSQIKSKDHQSLSIALLHSYLNPDHEILLKEVLEEEGISNLSLSHELAPLIKILPRAETSVVNAYLSPIIDSYIRSVQERITSGDLKVMSSAGGLTAHHFYQAKDSLLSGPAGGVVGAAHIAGQLGESKILTLDMGGTSTDVSRYDGDFDYEFESMVGDAHIYSPSLAIKTVAAGGGSICNFDGQKFAVGPESAGAKPGPAAYGSGVPLALTDVNLLLGRIDPNYFGIPVDIELSQKAFKKLIPDSNEPQGQEVILQGFLEIANERMAEAIRNISVNKGYDPRDYALLAFGGAGGLHACQIAQHLQIDKIIIPYDAGLLSAYGMGNATIERFSEKQILESLPKVRKGLGDLFHKLEEKATAELKKEGFEETQIQIRFRKLFLRFKGQDTSLEVDFLTNQKIELSFKEKYFKLFGHWIDDREIEVESAKVVASSLSRKMDLVDGGLVDYTPNPENKIPSYFNSQWSSIPVFKWDSLKPGANIKGPAILASNTSTTFIDPAWTVKLSEGLNATLSRPGPETGPYLEGSSKPQEIQLELFTNRFRSIAEDMGSLLQRTAFSVNIKERLDFSCALLDADGELVVNAPHIPVHLGSLGLCTRKVMKALHLEEGDVAITNHPGFGGSHLPDITLISPVFSDQNDLIGFVANRGHHAELGGRRPGSMPPDAKSLAEEGVVIPPSYLIRKGKANWDHIKQLLKEPPYPSRAVEENLADLNASLASLRLGVEGLRSLCSQYGIEEVKHYMSLLKEYASDLLVQSIKKLPGDEFKAEQFLDDGSQIKSCISIKKDTVSVDFSGSAPVHSGNLNANPSIVGSAVIYVLRLLINQELPLNEGIMKKVFLKIPTGILNPDFPSDPDSAPPVVGGNTETSQRLVDCLLKALGLASCSQGTMNNLLFGNENFGYYETIGGGAGAGPGFKGAHAVHQHMTNTRITDPEIMEYRYPVRLDRFSIREGSGGKGKWNGGNGIEREILFLAPVELTLLSQHRKEVPYGLAGGEPGLPGEQFIVRADGSTQILGGIDAISLKTGDRVVVRTPGGGGYGRL